MMTQFETDARRHELNYELQARNYEALRQYNEKKSRTAFAKVLAKAAMETTA